MEAADRSRRVPLVLITGVLALLLVAGLVQRTSDAAFTAQTDNPNNTFGAATIDLSNNREALSLARMFDVSDLVPGQEVDSCIEITYAGPAGSASPQAVKLYGVGTDDGLASSLDLTVEMYGAGQTCATASPTRVQTFTGTLSQFATRTDYGNGSTTWSPNDTDRTRAFAFTVVLRSGVGDGLQGAGASQDFIWEVRS
jgi:hypothetical protein